MTQLTPDIKERFFKTIYGEISIGDFEEWLYQSNELEQLLGADDHFELISYNFKQPGAIYGLIKLLYKHLDRAEYEVWRLHKLLGQVEYKEGDYPAAITEFYDLYSKGYTFFDNLAFGYSLFLECPNQYGVDTFEELTLEQQMNLANSCYPQILEETKRVKEWLKSDKIIPTGTQDKDYGHFKFIDNRTEEEKEPTTFKREEPSQNQLRKKWWQFWK
ncbi:hypothetical protein [Nafulsella turpanensis]|uniref:hypothetical protein n=1 Tax=Nafulsella turpanensis TaxID=1265690 RepID=UPI0003485171|nr:hypothetical protein [Nafulsella turpanensis]